MVTVSEAKEILVKRIGWKDDRTVSGFVVSEANALTNSGRYYQDEHAVVTLANIRDCQPLIGMDNDGFNEYLEQLKTQVAYQVLSDVFETDKINNRLFYLYPTAFDNLLRLRMVIVVSEIILTTTRFNITERYSKDFIGKLNYDIYREAPNKFAVRQINFVHTMGIATRYGFELQSVRRRFGAQRNQIKTITKGEVYNEYYIGEYYWDR